MMHYPPFEALGIAPDFLTFGRNAMDNLIARGYLDAPARAVRSLAPEERRAYDRTQRRNWAGRRKIEGRKVG